MGKISFIFFQKFAYKRFQNLFKSTANNYFKILERLNGKQNNKSLRLPSVICILP